MNIYEVKSIFRCVRSFSYYSKIAEVSDSIVSTLKYDDAIRILSRFMINREESILNEFYKQTNLKVTPNLTLDQYNIILDTCNKLSINDTDLLSSLSENIRTYLVKNVLIELDGSSSGGIPSNATFKSHELKESILVLCRIYNNLAILYDLLFSTISNILMHYVTDLNWNEVDLLLKTYSVQRFNDVGIVKEMVTKLSNTDLSDLSPSVAISMYTSLAHLDCLSLNLKNKLEGCFMEFDAAKFNGLDSKQLLDVSYSNLLLDISTESELNIVISSLIRAVELLNEQEESALSRRICIIVSYLRCKYLQQYDMIDESIRMNIERIISKQTNYKHHKSTKFVEKLSQHLDKMKIAHNCNVYKNGVLLDILERDRDLVWICNSYHRFYATTFNQTAQSRLTDRLIRLFGYKTCPINYYQWGRMKSKRTRFSFIRMARYYALNDKREYDSQYAGWSLPYIWWKVGKESRISSFIN